MRIMPTGLAARLILALTALVAVITGVSAYINVREQQQELLEEMVAGTDQLSRSITSATWHMMLLDRREAAYEVMQAIGRDQGVDIIRIFNKEGRITFSTDPNAPEQVDKNAEACFLCHVREQPLVRVDTPSRARIFRRGDGGRKMGMITPIYNEPACSNASCHAHPKDKSVLGVLDIVMDIDHIDQQATTIQYRAMIMTLVEVVLIGLLIALFTRYFVSSPIRKLMEGTKAVSAMDLDQRINIQTGGELGELAASFNVMQTRLKAAMNEINEFTHGLERKVDERTRQLSMTQQRLIQSDRLACLGQLAATVAHEINNPISGVLNLSMILQRLLREDSIPPGRLEEFRGYLNSITEETARVGRIVTDLLAFSRRSVPQTADADLNKIVMDTISLILHKLKLSSVTMDLELAEDLPVIPCDVSQMQQVIVNLVMNAAESIIGGGRVVLRTSLGEEGNSVVMEVEDSGAGIPEENLPRIFDPFFTTKEPGRGIGLGLSVVHGIVVAHGGTIGVTSRPGLGSTFTVHLPLYRSKAAGDGVSQGAERWNGA